MKTFISLTKRNTKVFFKDKAMFFCSLITPIILLVLYSTFLAKVYKDAFRSSIPGGVEVSSSLINGLVGGQLVSSLLAVSCITVAFCANILMVQDKANGVYKDFVISPVKKSKLSLSYYASTLISTLIVGLVALIACLIYIALTGWFMSFADIVLVIIDIFLLSMLGTAMASIVNIFLSSNGQASAVGTIVSSGYGFISGAYMPLSQFGIGLQRVLSFLPGTYGTSLLRNHAMNGAYREMARQNFPPDVIEKIKDSVDANLYFFGEKVSIGAMYGILIGAIVLLVGVFVLINIIRSNKLKKN